MPVLSPTTTLPPRHRLGLALLAALGLALSACSKKEEAAVPAAAAPAAAAASEDSQMAEAERAAAAAAAALAALSPEELRARGGQALREQRLYAPAGDNAMEYYLALRGKSDKPDASAESALIDLMPYAIIAAEQAIGREDFLEADRLVGLIQRADDQAPALPRIRDSIAKGRAGAAQRAAEALARTEQQQRERELAAQRAAEAAAAAAAQPATAPPTPTPAPAQPAPATPTPAPAQPQPAAPAPAQPTTPAPAPAQPVARTTPVPVSTPQPEFPPQALRSGITGEVTVELTIGRDGSVSDVRIIRAQPRGVFERSVLTTVRRWRFEPLDQEVTQSRTIVFR